MIIWVGYSIVETGESQYLLLLCAFKGHIRDRFIDKILSEAFIIIILYYNK